MNNIKSYFYAMDTNFYHSLGAYSFEARCEMTKELGFDATYLTLWNEQSWNDLHKLSSVREKYGLVVAAVYVTLDITTSHKDNEHILRMMEELEGCLTVEIALTCSGMVASDPAGDEKAIAWLERVLTIAVKRELTILLYPHVGFWLERIEDAVRLCRRMNHPSLGAIFTSFHWYAVDGKELFQKLETALPYLKAVNICGSRKIPGIQSGLPATIEPLDSGELDLFILLSWLHRLGFNGPVGLQGYAVGGDVYAKLRRSIQAYRDIERRILLHPEWSQLDPKLSWL